MRFVDLVIRRLIGIETIFTGATDLLSTHLKIMILPHRILLTLWMNLRIYLPIPLPVINQISFNDPESSIYLDEKLDDAGREFLNFESTAFSITSDQLSCGKLAQFYARFFLELREYHLLPVKVVQSISSSICPLCDIVIKLIKT